ncbi:MAG: SIMPL domain-containing protein [Pseudomonadaceae bacterium]|nr:SIMPL domain-containing protein [Pseudomonadaceae bacterium]
MTIHNSLYSYALAGALLAGGMSMGAVAPVRADDDMAAYLRNVTVLNLSADARKVVTQDRVRVNLNIQRDGKTAAEAQAAVNAKMQAALGMAKKVSAVKASTGYYNVYKQYPPEVRPLGKDEREKKAYWTAQQTLVLDGADKDAVLKLAGALQQQDFAMQGMNFYLSREASDAVKDELVSEALATIQTRAKAIAKQLGMGNVRVATMNIGGNMPKPQPYMARAIMMKADMAEAMPEPVGEAGESDVTVTVNAEVHVSR